MSSRLPRTVHEIAIAILALLIGLGCIYALTSMSSTWWNARSWQAVQGELVRAEIVKKSRKRGTSYIPTVSYNYSAAGASYTGDNLSLGWFPGLTRWHEKRTLKKLFVGQPITVWMNPRQPGQSVLYRGFDWFAALCWFLVAQLTFFFSLGLFRPNPTYSEGSMIPPAPESRGGFLLVVLGNLMVLPLGVTAVVEFRFWPLVTVIPMALFGIGIAVFKYQSMRRRWQLGPPLLTDASDGSTMSTARFIFSPLYGERLAGQPVNPEVSLEFEQVMYRCVRGTETLETTQTGSMGTVRLEFGVRSVDFTAQLPAWSEASNLRPAHWELKLKIAGTSLIYRIEPGFEH